VILIAAVATFGLAIWTRHLLNPGPTALEQLIAENAPAENVQALSLRPDGSLLAGTQVGVISQKGSAWERLPGIAGEVRALAPLGNGEFLVAGEVLGVSIYQGGNVQMLHKGRVHALAADPRDGRHLVAFAVGEGLIESRDAGRTWKTLAAFEGDDLLAVAISPDGAIATGGLQGAISRSDDAETQWYSPVMPGGTVTALAYDTAHRGRLWAVAGGRLLSTDDGGVSWQPANRKASDRPLIGLAVGPQKLFGVTADGLVVTVTR
jgi:hypothetical protein